MTSCSLRRLQELAAPDCNTSAVRGKRRRSRIPEPLVRVPIQRGAMTSDAPTTAGAAFARSGSRGKRRRAAAALARALSRGLVGNVRLHAGVRSADMRVGHFTLRGPMAENGTRGFREDHGDD